jgi:phosphonate transport system substrate-binding protein
MMKGLVSFCILFALLAPIQGSAANPPGAASSQKILLGILPEMNVFKQRQRFELLGQYLTRKTGVPISFTILSRYGNIIDRFTSEKMDGAFFGSFTGALAIRKLGVIPLARPVNLDNSSTYRGYIFVRKDSGLRNARDLRGKRMAFVERATTAGYIFPLAWLRDNGVTEGERFFRDSFYAGSHDAAIDAVLNGQADVGAAKHSIYDRVRKENKRIDEELTILAESPQVPSNGLCVRKEISPAVRDKLKAALLGLEADPEGAEVLRRFGALRFIETSAADYEPVFLLARKAGIDIAHYEYRNH